MKMQKRSFSLDNTNKKKIQRPLSIHHPGLKTNRNVGEMAKTSQEGNKWGKSIFKNQKEDAIKQIINGYFQEDINCDQLMVGSCNNRFAIRTQRMRKSNENNNKNSQSGLASSVNVEPAFSRTCHMDGWNQKKIKQLPPINQLAEDPEEPQNIRHSFGGSNTQSIMLRSSSAFSEMCNQEVEQVEERHLFAFENQLFKVSVVFRNGKPYARMKEFKQIGVPVLERELRMKNFNLPSIWYESKRSPFVYEMKIQSPLKDQLSKIGCDPANPLNLRVRPKALFKRLSANGFQELKSLLRLFCQDLKKVEGKIINNKVTTQNIFITKDYILCLAEWGYASFRDAFNIQKSTFQSRTNPILRGDKGWFLPPEYLAPQVISQIMGGHPQDVWNSPSSPDIWTLGLTIFQIMILVPVWCHTRCLVMARVNEYPTIKHVQKTGLLGVPGRDLKKLYQKQCMAQKNIEKQIEYWPQDCKQLGQLILQMVEPRLQHRISLDNLISRL